MSKRFKAEFNGCTVIVKSASSGKIVIDTTTADANKWANVPELEFMIEDDIIEQPKPVQKMVADSWEDFTLNELRERFPDIKATSKANFISQIQ